jgi:hypothetical protein
VGRMGGAIGEDGDDMGDKASYKTLLLYRYGPTILHEHNTRRSV